MNAETKRKCVREFSSMIQDADCETEPDKITVRYRIHGEQLEGIITDPISIADILKELCKITSYHLTSNGVKMETTKFITRVGAKGQPIMFGWSVEYGLADTVFSMDDAIKIAAIDYYNRAVAHMQTTRTAKIIYMNDPVVKRIA